MSARRSSLLAFGLSPLLTSVTADAVDPAQSPAVPGRSKHAVRGGISYGIDVRTGYA